MSRISDQKREQVLNLYTVGMSTSNISRALRIHPKTIQTIVKKSDDVKLVEPWTSKSMHSWKTYGRG